MPRHRPSHLLATLAATLCFTVLGGLFLLAAPRLMAPLWGEPLAQEPGNAAR